MTYPTFNAGDKVRSVFGKVYTVASQTDCVVYFTNGDCAHPTKIWKVA